MTLRSRIAQLEQYLADEAPDPEQSAVKARIVDVLMDRGIARKTAEEWCDPANNGLEPILREAYSEVTGTDVARRLAAVAVTAATEADRRDAVSRLVRLLRRVAGEQGVEFDEPAISAAFHRDDGRVDIDAVVDFANKLAPSHTEASS